MIQKPIHFPVKPALTLTNLALCCALLLGGCSKEKLTVEEHIQRANDFTAQGKVKEAQIELRNALGQDPKNPQAHLLLAEISFAQGNPDMAIVELKKASENGVSQEAVRFPMARALLMQGHVVEALKEATPGPNDSQTNKLKLMYLQSRALLALGRVDESCERSRIIHDLEPDAMVAALSLAQCAVARDRNFLQAEKFLLSALEKDKNNTELWRSMGDVHRAQGRIKDALAAYRTSLKGAPLNISTRTQLVSLEIAEANLKEAQQIIKEGMKLTPSPGLRYYQAMVDYKQGRYTQAEETLSQVLAVAPNYPPVVLLSGQTALALGHHEQAIKYLGRYLGQNPNSSLARRTLAEAQLHHGLAAQVPATLAPLIGGDKPDGIALNLAGQAYMALGDNKSASVYLQKAAALDPKDSLAQALLGISHMTSGEVEKALGELKAASQHAPQNTGSDRLLIAYFMNHQDYDQALAAIAVMEKKQSSDPETHNQRGLAYLGKKDYAAARASFEKSLALRPTYLPAASGLARLDLVQFKNYNAARQRFEAILDKDKTNTQAMIALARLAEIQQKDSEYVDWLKKAIALDKTPNIRLMLAEHYLQKHDAKNALTTAREAQSTFPASVEALTLLGRAQTLAGEKNNAMATYTKLIALAPKAPGGYYALGLLQAEAKQWTGAQQSLAKAFELMPNSIKAAEALATLELAQGRTAEAIKVARRFQQATPKTSAGLTLEGELLIHQGRAKEAAQILSKAYSLDKSVNNLMKLHKAQAAAGDVPGADKQLLAWLQASPKDIAARQYFAATLAARKAYPEAARQYETLLAQSPNNPFFTNDLAWAYAKMNDPRALATAEQAVKLYPGSANALDTLGWILVEKEQLPRGLKLLEQAVTNSAGARPDIRYHWAAALARSGDKTRARKELEQVLQAKKPFPQQQEAKTLMQQLR